MEMKRLPTHPGKILKRELEARGLSANKLALALGVPSGRITDILNGKRAITPDTAIRLGEFFVNSPQFWLNLQTKYDLIATDLERGAKIRAQVRASA
jgi:addiction module HigA family antidote